jgi:hypothetical protein
MQWDFQGARLGIGVFRMRDWAQVFPGREAKHRGFQGCEARQMGFRGALLGIEVSRVRG